MSCNATWQALSLLHVYSCCLLSCTQDVHLWLPNLFGAVIGVIQLGLRVVYGARSDSDMKVVSVMEVGVDIEVAFAQAQAR